MTAKRRNDNPTPMATHRGPGRCLHATARSAVMLAALAMPAWQALAQAQTQTREAAQSQAGEPGRAEAPVRAAVIYPFELVDSSEGKVALPDRDERLRMLTDLLKREFEARRLYDVVQSPQADAAIDAALARADLRTCNGCDARIAAAAGVDRVVVTWVQMVSNLILSVNIEVRDADGKPVLNKSADMRGNTVRDWQRALTFITRSMDERNQRNR